MTATPKPNNGAIFVQTVSDYPLVEALSECCEAPCLAGHIRLLNARSFMFTEQESLSAKKSVFNRIIGDRHFELEFASFLENCKDVLAYAKNYLAVNYKLDYINRDGNIPYHSDFIVKLPKNRIVIVETKSNADLGTHLKMERMRQCCENVNKAQNEVKYKCLYVEREEF